MECHGGGKARIPGTLYLGGSDAFRILGSISFSCYCAVEEFIGLRIIENETGRFDRSVESTSFAGT